MYRRHGRTATPQHAQFVARERAAGVQRDLAFPLHHFSQAAGPPAQSRGQARRTRPDRHQRRVPGALHRACTCRASARAFPPGCGAISRDDFADAISRPLEFQRQRAAQSSRPHNRDAWFDGHRRSIALAAHGGRRPVRLSRDAVLHSRGPLRQYETSVDGGATKIQQPLLYSISMPKARKKTDQGPRALFARGLSRTRLPRHRRNMFSSPAACALAATLCVTPVRS